MVMNEAYRRRVAEVDAGSARGLGEAERCLSPGLLVADDVVGASVDEAAEHAGE
jgi:hypothetical protein